jgi:hypothetical protein
VIQFGGPIPPRTLLRLILEQIAQFQFLRDTPGRLLLLAAAHNSVYSVDIGVLRRPLYRGASSKPDRGENSVSLRTGVLSVTKTTSSLGTVMQAGYRQNFEITNGFMLSTF